MKEHGVLLPQGAHSGIPGRTEQSISITKAPGAGSRTYHARSVSIQLPVTAAIKRCTMPSMDLVLYQCQTNTISCSGSIHIVLPPWPMAAKAEAGPLGHCFCLVFSHQR